MDRFRNGMEHWRAELGPLLALAGPVVAAELGWMAMGVVDTIFVGRLGAEAIGAVSLGNALYFAVAVFGMGLLLGLDTLVSQAYGAGRKGECHDWLIQGTWLGALVCPPAILLLWAVAHYSDRLGLHPAVLAEAKLYLWAAAWGTPALLAYAALRRYLQGMGLVKPIMLALVTANLVNVVADWALIYGRLGLPALGVEGSGWATTASRFYMAGFLLVFAIRHDLRDDGGLLRTSLAPRFGAMVRMLKLGLPAAFQVTLEVGVFAAVTTLAGTLDPVSLAAHHVALGIASVSFMIPLGLASAGAVRVGQALGRGEPAAAGRAGWLAVMLGAAFMLTAGLVMIAFPRTLSSVFTTDSAVIAKAAGLMVLAAAFQLFDGLQGVSTGAMRGVGDTRTPMVCNLISHWGIGLPLGYLLAFHADLGVFGLWIGLAMGLGVAGIFLSLAWRRKAGALARGEFALAGAGVGH